MREIRFNKRLHINILQNYESREFRKLIEVFPNNNTEEKFIKLMDAAYLEAHYNPNFLTTKLGY